MLSTRVHYCLGIGTLDNTYKMGPSVTRLIYGALARMWPKASSTCIPSFPTPMFMVGSAVAMCSLTQTMAGKPIPVTLSVALDRDVDCVSYSCVKPSG